MNEYGMVVWAKFSYIFLKHSVFQELNWLLIYIVSSQKELDRVIGLATDSLIWAFETELACFNGKDILFMLSNKRGRMIFSYPAGYIWFYLLLSRVTGGGKDIRSAQYIFAFLYLANLLLVFRMYYMSHRVCFEGIFHCWWIKMLNFNISFFIPRISWWNRANDLNYCTGTGMNHVCLIHLSKVERYISTISEIFQSKFSLGWNIRSR